MRSNMLTSKSFAQQAYHNSHIQHTKSVQQAFYYSRAKKKKSIKQTNRIQMQKHKILTHKKSQIAHTHSYTP